MNSLAAEFAAAGVPPGDARNWEGRSDVVDAIEASGDVVKVSVATTAGRQTWSYRAADADGWKRID